MSFNLSNKVNNLTNLINSIIPSSGVVVCNNLTATTGAITNLASTAISTATLTCGNITGSLTYNLNPATGMLVSISGTAISISLATANANNYIVGQKVIVQGNANGYFNGVEYTITQINSAYILQTNNPTSIPALEVGGGGTVSGGIITTRDLTATNLNGKLNVVGGTSNSGNLLFCNNTTSTTGNFDLLTDSNQHLKFTATNNVLTVGGATNGSIVIPSTNGFITVPAVNASSGVNTNLIASTGSNTIRLRTSDGTYSTYFSSAGSFPVGTQAGMFIHTLSTASTFYSYNNIGGSGTAIPMNFQASDYTWQAGASGATPALTLTATALGIQSGTIQTPSTCSIYAGGSGAVNLICTDAGNIGFYTNNGGGSGGIFNAANIQSFDNGGVQAGYIDIHHASGVAAGAVFTQFVYAGVAIGSITQFGTTEVRFNTTSDYRLKSNIKPIDTSLLQKLKPCSFTWNQDNRDSIGFIAHEFAEVFPDDVINQKDEVDKSGKPKYQQMSNNACIPLLVSCVQEQHQIVKDQQKQIDNQQKQIDELKLLVNSIINKPL